MTEKHDCDSPVDDTGEEEWICPECGRVWEYQQDFLGADEDGNEVIEDWWEPRDDQR